MDSVAAMSEAGQIVLQFYPIQEKSEFIVHCQVFGGYMGLTLSWVNLRSSHSPSFLFSVKAWCCTTAVAEQPPWPVLSAAPHWRWFPLFPLFMANPTSPHYYLYSRWWNGSWTNLAKKTKLSKKSKNQLAQSDSLHCHANLGKESAITYQQLPMYLAVKQPWNCVNQAVVLGDGKEKPYWLFELEIRAPFFTSLGVSKLNQEGVKKHWTCRKKVFALQ